MRELAVGASTAFAPQCGLAPGFVSIVGFDMAKRFKVLDSVKLRVGALPQYPSNALNYNLTWSTDGVINEYCEPCEAIANGTRREVTPLEEREEFSLDGVTYEAFNTSGGLGTLCDTLEGKVRTLNYRTICYPGHAVIMRALLNDLRLRDRRDVLKDILENAVPTTLQDVVIVFVTVSGRNNGELVQNPDANKIYSRDVDGRTLSAIQITTAAAISTVLDLLATRQLPQSGFVRQEDIPLKAFLENRFGRVLQSLKRVFRTNGSEAPRDHDRFHAPTHFVVRDDGATILTRLGVPDRVFADEGQPTSSPITGELITIAQTTTPKQTSEIIGRAAQAFNIWRSVPAPRRGELVRILAEDLRSAKDDLGRLVTIETGKIASEGLGEVQEMIDICDFAVGLSRQLYGRTIATERTDHRMMEIGIRSAYAVSSLPSTFRRPFGPGTPPSRWCAAIWWSGSPPRKHRSPLWRSRPLSSARCVALAMRRTACVGC